MERMIETVGWAGNMWKHGAFLAFMLLVSLMAAGLMVGIPLLVLSSILGLGNEWAMDWLALTAILWAPVAVGNVMRFIPPRLLNPRG